MANPSPRPRSQIRAPQWAHQRYDFAGQGRTVVFVLMLLFLATAVTYRWLHLAWPTITTAPRPEEFVHVSRIGLVTITSAEDIDWYVGDKAKPILVTINQQNQEIAETHSRIREIVGRLSGTGTADANQAGAKLLAALHCAENGSLLAVRNQPRQPNLRQLRDSLHELAATSWEVRSLDLLDQSWADELDERIQSVTAISRARTEAGQPLDPASKQLRDAIEDLQRTIVTRPQFPSPQNRPVEDVATSTPGARDLTKQLSTQVARLEAWLDRQGDPMGAFDRFVLDGGDLSPAHEALIDDLRMNVARLIASQQQQRDAVSALRPPVKLTFFWMSPGGVLAEVLFWSAFGVLTNLMLNVAEAVRKRGYEPRELTVVVTKLLYGPIVSLVLCLTILTGMMNVGGYEVRAWSLPLLGFFFGFNARKSAALIDRLSVRIFGAASKSIDAGPKAVAEARQQALEKYLVLIKPVTLGELRDAAKQVATDTVKNIVQHNEAIQ